MTNSSTLTLCALMLCVPLAVSGCATSSATPTTTTRVVDVGTKKLRPFETRAADTCETQRAAAAENSVRDSRPGKPIVYCARCDCPELYSPAALQMPTPSTHPGAASAPPTS
ncbi:MAG TPA: hypothetical protein PLW75_01340 [Hyphomicrobium sp.]|nr:hypothetical protein [Hyphomicrobium sp.]